MGKTKERLAARVAELERQLMEAQAMEVHRHHFVDAELHKFSTEKCYGSAVILQLTVLGGRLKVEPIGIRNGLSPETIEALKADLRRSYAHAVEFKPRGAS